MLKSWTGCIRGVTDTLGDRIRVRVRGGGRVRVRVRVRGRVLVGVSGTLPSSPLHSCAAALSTLSCLGVGVRLGLGLGLGGFGFGSGLGLGLGLWFELRTLASPPPSSTGVRSVAPLGGLPLHGCGDQPDDG